MPPRLTLDAVIFKGPAGIGVSRSAEPSRINVYRVCPRRSPPLAIPGASINPVFPSIRYLQECNEDALAGCGPRSPQVSRSPFVPLDARPWHYANAEVLGFAFFCSFVSSILDVGSEKDLTEDRWAAFRFEGRSLDAVRSVANSNMASSTFW